jgi:hypothetical protein
MAATTSAASTSKTTTKAPAKTTAKKPASTLDVSGFKPGQQLVCTVTATPRTDDQTQTIERLMRNDKTAQKALRRAQRMRGQREVIYNRGNRDWVKREKTARVVRVAKDASWSMAYRLDMAPDLKSVAAFLSVKAK